MGALTAAFGSAPLVDRETPTVEPGPRTTYTWPGLVIVDDDWPATAPLDADYYVIFSAAEINSVSLATVEGITIGDSALPLEAEYPDSASGASWEELTVHLGTIDLPRSEANPRDGSSLSVLVNTDNPEGVITSISAPAFNHGVV